MKHLPFLFLVALVAVAPNAVHAAHNISVSNIPDAHVVAPYFGDDYGGGYSDLVNVHIQSLPTNWIQVSIVAQAGLETIPAAGVTFSSTGSKTQQIRFRAHTRGTRTIAFQVSGPSIAEFDTNVPSRVWRVLGPNRNCWNLTAENDCWQANGCRWMASRPSGVKCLNTTLPIAHTDIPSLYSNEQSAPITLTLPAAVKSSLTVTFVPVNPSSGSAVLSDFAPSSSITFAAGATTATFQITATTRAFVKQPFQLVLSGPDANVYQQQVIDAFVYPATICTCAPLPGYFLVGSDSAFLTIACNQAPASDIIFTPNTTASGYAFVPENVNSSVPTSVVLLAGSSSGRFRVTTIGGLIVGPSLYTHTITFAISGTNAGRFAPIPDSSFRVLPYGNVSFPPGLFLTQFDTSQRMHIDLNRPPTANVVFDLAPEHEDGSSANLTTMIQPSRIVFRPTGSRLGGFNVTANGQPGSYFIRIVASGAGLADFILPASNRIPLQVLDPVDGKAFEARAVLAHMSNRRSCRVNVGFQSVRFKGQAPVSKADQFCAEMPQPANPNATTHNCGQWTTLLACRNVLQNTGDACAWHNNECVFLPGIQGEINAFTFGSFFTAFLLKNSTVYTIGSSRYGQLGHSSPGLGWVNITEPVSTIQAGASHVIALTGNGNVWSWGANTQGQLGQNTRQMFVTKPVKLTFPIPRQNITCITSGQLHSGALSITGNVWMWGSNEVGQLGFREVFREALNRPLRISPDKFDGPVIALQAGEFHTMAATVDTAYTWGSNRQGQLGRDGYNRTGLRWQDEYEPAPTLLWVPKRFVTPPSWPGHLLGRDCPA